ncbi:MAG: hypothetical protein LBO69_01430 [Ignavibacteria bacterium]|jgi:hypothetical protein|nr:hypothetical protein [Ignavibacteria bacterium]
MTVTEFYNEYQTKRKTCLDEGEFTAMLVMYPAVLVGYADKHLDKDEKKNFVASLAEIAKEDEVVAYETYSELTYLMLAQKPRRDEALGCLKEYLQENAEDKELVIALMNSMAETSDGISAVEQKKIDELKTILSL